MKPDEVGVLFPRSDAEIISDMVRWWKQQSGKPTPLSPPLLPQAPEVYIAKTPTAGIPSRTDGPGTGTDESVANVNFADCDLYRIDHRTNSDIDVEPIGVSRPIYNLGSTNLPGNSLILAIRDKAGKFLAVDLASDEADPCSIRCGWVAGLLTTDCLAGSVVSSTGRCETDTDTAWTAEFEWNGTDEVWDADTPLEISGVEYDVHFLRDHDPDGDDPSVGGDPQMYLTRTDASGTTKYWATLDCCGDNYAIFAIAGGVCTGDTTCGESQPSQNITRIRVDYQQCTSAGTSGWAGPGWYCVTSETGTVADSEGPNHGDTATSTALSMISTVEWTTPSNASATDTVTTSAIGAGGLGDPTRTQALEVTDFDFSTLTGELTGITVTVRKSRGSGGMGGTNVTDYMLCLIVDGTAVTSVNKADTVTVWGASLADATYTFNAADIVSVGLTLAKLKQSNFGVRLQADFAASDGRANVDSITVTATSESEPCDNTTCQYLAEDPGVCEEDWLDYFRICAGPFQTAALCAEICAIPDPDDEPPLDPVDAPCQSRSFASVTAVISNAYGAMEWLGVREMTASGLGTDAATFNASGNNGGTATLDIACSGGQYTPSAGSQLGECGGMSDSSDTSTETVVFFNDDPFVLIVDVACTYSGGACGTTTGGYRVTITLP